MPKNTAIVLIILGLTATLLFGINIGKKLGVSQSVLPQTQIPTAYSLQPTTILSPTTSINRVPSGNPATYTDQSCGFSISYKGSFMEQTNENYRSTIITDPENPDESIVTTCQEEIPKPPLLPEKIEDITLDGVPAKLYHDASSKDGSPRDEVIVKHPVNNQEIFIAGFGPAFNDAIASLKFLK